MVKIPCLVLLNRTRKFMVFLVGLLCLLGISYHPSHAQNVQNAAKLNQEPNAIIDWNVLKDILPNAKVPENLPAAPQDAPKSGFNLEILSPNQGAIKGRTTSLQDMPTVNTGMRQKLQAIEEGANPFLAPKDSQALTPASAPPALPQAVQQDIKNPFLTKTTHPPAPPSNPPSPSPVNNNTAPLLDSPASPPAPDASPQMVKPRIIANSPKPPQAPKSPDAPTPPKAVTASKEIKSKEVKKPVSNPSSSNQNKDKTAPLPTYDANTALALINPKSTEIGGGDNLMPAPETMALDLLRPSLPKSNSPAVNDPNILLRLLFSPKDMNISQSQKEEIAQLVQRLNQSKKMNINLYSYAHNPDDNRIDESMMRRVSLDRARELKNLLMKEGIASYRIFLRPMGDGLVHQLQTASNQSTNHQELYNRIDIRLAK